MPLRRAPAAAVLLRRGVVRPLRLEQLLRRVLLLLPVLEPLPLGHLGLIELAAHLKWGRAQRGYRGGLGASTRREDGSASCASTMLLIGWWWRAVRRRCMLRAGGGARCHSWAGVHLIGQPEFGHAELRRDGVGWPAEAHMEDKRGPVQVRGRAAGVLTACACTGCAGSAPAPASLAHPRSPRAAAGSLQAKFCPGRVSRAARRAAPSAPRRRPSCGSRRAAGAAT